MKASNNTSFKNKSLIHFYGGIIITSLLCSLNLQAQPLPQRGPIPFYIYDLNSNGSISQDEFHTIRGQRMEYRASQGYPMKNMASEPQFSQFDTNNDAQLSPEELSLGLQLQRQKRIKMMQAQGRAMPSGMCRGHRMPQFEDFDQNKDGQLTPEEFTLGMQQHMQKKRAMGSGQGMGMGQPQGRGMGMMGQPQGRGMGMMGQPQGRGMGMMGQPQGRGTGMGMNRGQNMPEFEDFDANKDGMISEQELIEARGMRISSRIQQGYQMRNTANIPSFKEIDTNSDGHISPEEFTAHQKSHQMKRKNTQGQ